ncbi:MAG TPA: DUF58 domain-containing protein [Terriglobales bacterium]|jgi:uncharacterized protein (DUF58 family)
MEQAFQSVTSGKMTSGKANSGKTHSLSFWGIPEVWIRFLLAIVGLGLAFAAALFSTVSRDAGNLWATLVLASLALLLATFVGLTTVPYLAKRVAVARIRHTFDYEVTRAGIVYVLAVLVIGIAALNTGNNLLYIVVACMLGAILVSGVVSAIALSDLELDVRLTEHVFAGENAPGSIIVRNPRRLIPAISLSVVSATKEKIEKRLRWVRSTFGFPFASAPEKQWFKLADWKLKRVAAEDAPAKNLLQSPVYFPYIAPGSSQRADIHLLFPQRGRFQQKGFGLSTRFPFAFLRKTRNVPSESEMIVYPSIQPVDRMSEILPQISGELETFLRGRGAELYSIRDCTPEDSSRHVDWKATAKSGSLKVREFARDEDRKLRIVFDNPVAGSLSQSAYEQFVQTTASLSWHFSRANIQLSFVAQDYDGNPDVFAFLHYLALVQPRSLKADQNEVIPPIWNSLNSYSGFNVILTNHHTNQMPSMLPENSFVISSTSV